MQMSNVYEPPRTRSILFGILGSRASPLDILEWENTHSTLLQTNHYHLLLFRFVKICFNSKAGEAMHVAQEKLF